MVRSGALQLDIVERFSPDAEHLAAYILRQIHRGHGLGLGRSADRRAALPVRHDMDEDKALSLQQPPRPSERRPGDLPELDEAARLRLTFARPSPEMSIRYFLLRIHHPKCPGDLFFIISEFASSTARMAEILFCCGRRKAREPVFNLNRLPVLEEAVCAGPCKNLLATDLHGIVKSDLEYGDCGNRHLYLYFVHERGGFLKAAEDIHDRGDDTFGLELVETVAHTVKQVNARLFHEAHIVGMMCDTHAVTLVVLNLMNVCHDDVGGGSDK